MEEVNVQIGTYTITTPSGRVYVGVTNDGYSARWEQHEKLLRRGVHHCTGLQNSYNKYGWDNLVKEPVMSFDPPATKDERDDLGAFLLSEEARLWRVLNEHGTRLLNGEPTGTGSVYHLEESIEKTRIAMKDYHSQVCKIFPCDCVLCHSLFYSPGPSGKYCYTCIPWSSRKRRQSDPLKASKICDAKNCCNMIPGTRKKYCSTECRNSIHHTEDITLKCAFCTTEVKNASKYIVGAKAFCDKTCFSSYRLETKMSVVALIQEKLNMEMSISGMAREIGYSRQLIHRYIKEFELHPENVR